jgi:hypothetical protein
MGKTFSAYTGSETLRARNVRRVELFAFEGHVISSCTER